MGSFGLTPNGFVAKQLQQIKTEIETVLKDAFGQNINLNPNSKFGNIVGIFSEREALIWQLAEAVSDSQSPNGAEGTSVDNILALNNLRRLKATPTRTQSIPLVQNNGITLYGLLLFGTPGTTILAGAIMQTQDSPPLQFTLDNAVTIQPAVNCVQNLYLSNVPDSGSFSLGLTTPLGALLVTESFNFDVSPNLSRLKFSSIPVSGTFDLNLSMNGTTESVTGLSPSDTASSIQTKIRALSGYSAATVTGTYSAGFTIGFPAECPTIGISNNTMGITITAIDSIQGSVNNLFDGTNYPFTDVQVQTAVNGFVFLFGAFAPATSQPSTAGLPQPIILIESNSLQMGTEVTNAEVKITTQGALAQGIGSATCAQTGPNFVGAGSLNTIGSSQSGWTGVTNQLDCTTGTNVETDTDAMVRRSESLQSNANGPLPSIIQKVSLVNGVTAVKGFQNLNDAALQIISFSSVPVSGSFKIQLQAGITSSIAFNSTNLNVQSAIRAISGYENCLVTGDFMVGFTIDFNGDFGGQTQLLAIINTNTLGVTVTPSFGRPGHSVEIVASGGSDIDIATAIFKSTAGGIQTFGTTTVNVFDDLGNLYNISFSRPTNVPMYVVIQLQTDLGQANPKFNIGSIQQIIDDILSIGNKVGIGGLVVGFGTNGLIGAFNDIPGITHYNLFFDRLPNPSGNANIQMQPEETPAFESFNVKVSYT